MPAEPAKIDYRLTLISSEPRDKLEELHHLELKWGNVKRTVTQELEQKGEMVVKRRNED